MDSNMIVRYGFKQWHLFSLRNKRPLLLQAGDNLGVYVIRHGSGGFGRLQGSSDILYIGKTTGQGGMKARIYPYFNPGPTQWTNQRIYSFLQRQVPMEISFVTTQKPRQFELELLQ